MLIGGASLLGLAIMFAYFPRLLVFPIVVLFLWFGIALVYRSFKLYWMKDQQDLKQPDTPPSTQDEPESSATSIGPG
jgi:cardiolipin synthase